MAEAAAWRHAELRWGSVTAKAHPLGACTGSRDSNRPASAKINNGAEKA